MTPLLSPQVAQAVVAGLFVAVGWWVTQAQNRRRDALLRAERVRDVQRALFAEIRADIALLRRDETAEMAAATRARIEAEEGYFPLILNRTKDLIFRAIVAEIHILPRDTIDPVVLYYHQLAAISALVADLRALDPGRIGPQRAAALYGDYIEMTIEAQALGEAALAAIVANVDGTARVSSRRGAGRSGRGSA